MKTNFFWKSLIVILKELFIIPDDLESIKKKVFIFQHKNILMKENIYLLDHRKSVKLEVVN